VTLIETVDQLRRASLQWSAALDGHWDAPPDQDFAERLRAFSLAAKVHQVALEQALADGLGWTPVQHSEQPRLPPYELQQGTGRVGPKDLWARFDEQFMAWDRSLEGTDIGRIADLFTQLSETTAALADAVDQLRGVSVDPIEGGRRALGGA
jgi:hypothetical protein